MLDTNIWLDWLVFHDQAIAPLKRAFSEGRLVLAIDPACLAELTRVLAYPLGRFTLDAQARERAHAACLACARIEAPAPRLASLPVCRDADDQKFLELARDCDADYLVTRDRDLLSLRRRVQPGCGFRIVTPSELAAGLAAP